MGRNVHRLVATRKLKLDEVRRDGGTQMRASLSKETIEEYAETIKGASFPPIVVFYDGDEYWLADGFHRVAAAASASVQAMEAEVHSGTRRDAILYAAGANAAHGLRRTNADKQRAVKALLDDEEWSKRSNRWIAQVCNVARRTVDNYRKATGQNAQLKTIGLDGKERRPPTKVERDDSDAEVDAEPYYPPLIQRRSSLSRWSDSRKTHSACSTHSSWNWLG
jgi:hypothetical protein